MPEMMVRFQYADFTEWEGVPENAHNSPDKGVIRMYATDDQGYVMQFTYHDIYYLYPVDEGWLFGGATPWLEYVFKPGVGGCNGIPRPFELPDRAIVRHGETVSQEDAVKFGLIKTVDTKVLHKKKRIEVKRCKDC